MRRTEPRGARSVGRPRNDPGGLGWNPTALVLAMSADTRLASFTLLEQVTGIKSKQLWRFTKPADHPEHREPTQEQKATIAVAFGKPLRFFETPVEVRSRKPRRRRA